MINERRQKLQGISLLLFAVFIFPVFDALAKYLGQLGNPVIQTVWARMVLGTLLLAPLLIRVEGVSALKPRALPIHLIRGIASVISTFCFFSALATQGLAETLSLFFIQPIIVTAVAPLMLREHVGLHRWLAVVAGFIGVLVILRPGYIALSSGSAFALASGFASAITLLTSRLLADRASALANTFYSSLCSAIMTMVLAIGSWQSPSLYVWGLMLAVAVIGTIANYCVIKAFEKCEASILAPFGYAEMISAVAVGWYFFGDIPDFYAFVGIAILIGAAIYTSRLETRPSASQV